jgi:integrase
MNAICPEAEAAVKTSQLVRLIEAAALKDSRKRDLLSAVTRLLKVSGVTHGDFLWTAVSTRELLDAIKPAAHAISARTFANIRSDIGAALALAGVTTRRCHGDRRIGASWQALVELIDQNMPLYGLRRFIRFCSSHGIDPDQVNNASVAHFQGWLTSSTLVPNPSATARAIPRLWRLAQALLETLPGNLADPVKTRDGRKLAWDELPKSFLQEANAYLDMRRHPDIFDERLEAPRKPLAESTVRLQREHIRLSCCILLDAGDSVLSLADLVEPERFKTVLRYYHQRAVGAPCSFATGLAKTLISVAKHFVHASSDHLARLKATAARLPAIPFDMTTKNKRFISEMCVEEHIAKLVKLPRLLALNAETLLDSPKRLSIVANVALALAVLLEAPMRSQNLITLNWKKHFREPRGPRGPLQILIDASEVKSKRSDLVFELSPETSEFIRWYRKFVLPALSADPGGDLFVMEGGWLRGQGDLANRVKQVIEDHVGISMTMHQFRHLAAARYLEIRPHDIETIRQLLGHAFAKTTAVYAGLNGERASRAFGEIVITKSAEMVRRAKPKRRHARRKE